MYFSVKRAVRIAGKNYFPCICYPLTDFLKSTVEKLEKEGKAKVYDHFVFFQNGKIIENSRQICENPAKSEPIMAETTFIEPVEEPEIKAEMPLKEQEETVKKSKKPHKKAEKSTEKDETEGF